jgi:putative redox protein
MVDITGKYLGEKRVEMIHGPSKAKIITDAPIDNHGKGESFSPTDLVASALGTCMLTVMGIYAEARNIDLTGSTFNVKKNMQQSPRKISSLPITLHLPKSISEVEREKLVIVAKTCPVKASLNPDIEILIDFIFDV